MRFDSNSFLPLVASNVIVFIVKFMILSPLHATFPIQWIGKKSAKIPEAQRVFRSAYLKRHSR